jgi:hypothetical protein
VSQPGPPGLTILWRTFKVFVPSSRHVPAVVRSQRASSGIGTCCRPQHMTHTRDQYHRAACTSAERHVCAPCAVYPHEMSRHPDAKRSPKSTTRTRYVPPADTAIVATTAAALLRGARPIKAASQQLKLTELALERPLWAVGDRELLQQPCAAVIGIREVSPEGAARARRLARELTQAGIVVLSGLARGVDTEALSAAIQAGGRVVGVIGTPLDKASPVQNSELQQEIYRNHLLIVSLLRRGATRTSART